MGSCALLFAIVCCACGVEARAARWHQPNGGRQGHSHGGRRLAQTAATATVSNGQELVAALGDASVATIALTGEITPICKSTARGRLYAPQRLPRDCHDSKQSWAPAGFLYSVSACIPIVHGDRGGMSRRQLSPKCRGSGLQLWYTCKDRLVRRLLGRNLAVIAVQQMV